MIVEVYQTHKFSFSAGAPLKMFTPCILPDFDRILVCLVIKMLHALPTWSVHRVKILKKTTTFYYVCHFLSFRFAWLVDCFLHFILGFPSAAHYCRWSAILARDAGCECGAGPYTESPQDSDHFRQEAPWPPHVQGRPERYNSSSMGLLVW